MNAVGVIAGIANTIILLYVLALFARFILELIPLFNREWRPRGFGLVLAEFVFTITDPPIKFFRKVIPPIKMGPVALDLAFALTMLICFIALSVTSSLAR